MDYQQIVEGLIKQGKITEEDVKNIVDAEDEEIKALAVLLHSLLCKENHTQLEEYTMGLAGCSFYAEEQVDDTWNLYTHKKWFGVAKAISEHQDASKLDKELIVRLCNAIATREEYTDLFVFIYIELSKAGLTKAEY